MVITSWYYQHLKIRIGAEGRITATVTGASVIAVGAFGTGAVGGAFGWPMLAATGPAFSIAVGLIIFAVAEHSRGLAFAAGMIVVPTAAALFTGIDARTASVTLLVICGLVGVAVGIGLRGSARRAT